MRKGTVAMGWPSAIEKLRSHQIAQPGNSKTEIAATDVAKAMSVKKKAQKAQRLKLTSKQFAVDGWYNC